MGAKHSKHSKASKHQSDVELGANQQKNQPNQLAKQPELNREQAVVRDSPAAVEAHGVEGGSWNPKRPDELKGGTVYPGVDAPGGHWNPKDPAMIVTELPAIQRKKNQF